MRVLVAVTINKYLVKSITKTMRLNREVPVVGLEINGHDPFLVHGFMGGGCRELDLDPIYFGNLFVSYGYKSGVSVELKACST